MFQQYASSELGPVTLRKKATSRADPVEATCVLAEQKKVEDVNQFRPFLHEVVPHHFQQLSGLQFRNTSTDQNG